MSDWERRPDDAAHETSESHDVPAPAEPPAVSSAEPAAASPAEDRSAGDPPVAPEPTAELEPPVFAPYAFRPADVHQSVATPADAAAGEAWPAEAARGPAPATPVAPPIDWPTASGSTASGRTVAAAAAATATHPSAWTRVGEELVAWFKTLVSAAVYATLIVTFGFQVARVEGLSMAPTLEDQDRLIVNKLAYRLHDPQVGDIVMLYYPVDPQKSFVKRIVAEPGDTIRSVRGRVYRNDVPLDDAFIPEEYRSEDTWGPETIPDGYYFVMGDHRNNSSDSRTWKYVPTKYIIGKVQLRWWPMDEFTIF